MMCSKMAVTNSLRDKLAARCHIEKSVVPERSIDECLAELNKLKIKL